MYQEIAKGNGEKGVKSNINYSYDKFPSSTRLLAFAMSPKGNNMCFGPTKLNKQS